MLIKFKVEIRADVKKMEGEDSMTREELVEEIKENLNDNEPSLMQYEVNDWSVIEI